MGGGGVKVYIGTMIEVRCLEKLDVPIYIVDPGHGLKRTE